VNPQRTQRALPIQSTIRFKLVLEDLEGHGTKSQLVLDSRTLCSSSIMRRQWGSSSTLRTKDGMGDNDGNELHAIHMLDDLNNTMSDHRVCVVQVTSHTDGVVDWQLSAEVH
jgi:hypothetical protein